MMADSFVPNVTPASATADCLLATEHGWRILKSDFNIIGLDEWNWQPAVYILARQASMCGLDATFPSFPSFVKIDSLLCSLRSFISSKLTTHPQLWGIATRRFLTPWKRSSTTLGRLSICFESGSLTKALNILLMTLFRLKIYEPRFVRRPRDKNGLQFLYMQQCFDTSPREPKEAGLEESSLMACKLLGSV